HMALRAEDNDEQHIASSKALLITCKHFSTDQVFKAISQALDYDEKHGVKRVLDNDNRQVLRGQEGNADAETRYLADHKVTQ
ncbi:5-dehydro-2-deoxygluconokinase, partial [Pseudomonas syringae pv. tagetis]